MQAILIFFFALFGIIQSYDIAAAKIYLKNRGVPFDYGGGEAGVCNTADDF